MPWWRCFYCRHVSSGLLFLIILLILLLLVFFLFFFLFFLLFFLFLFFLLIEHGDTSCLYTPFVLPRLYCHISRRTLFV